MAECPIDEMIAAVKEEIDSWEEIRRIEDHVSEGLGEKHLAHLRALRGALRVLKVAKSWADDNSALQGNAVRALSAPTEVALYCAIRGEPE